MVKFHAHLLQPIGVYKMYIPHMYSRGEKKIYKICNVALHNFLVYTGRNHDSKIKGYQSKSDKMFE